MPLRSPKMYFCIFGFQRLVWWPKCTPASSSSFIVIAAMCPPRLASAALRVSVPVPKPRGVRDGDVAPLNLDGSTAVNCYLNLDGPTAVNCYLNLDGSTAVNCYLNLDGPTAVNCYDGPWPSTVLGRVLRVEPD